MILCGVLLLFSFENKRKLPVCFGNWLSIVGPFPSQEATAMRLRVVAIEEHVSKSPQRYFFLLNLF